MAETWTNTVPQGVIGTGNAQVFGVNPVAGQFAGQLQNLRNKQQAEAQQMAKAWRDNQLAASSGRLWAKDMTGIEKGFIDRGIELQQKGVNPYGSSKEALDYQRDKRYVEAQQGYRKAVETQLNDALKRINANPDKYDPKSIREINDFFEKTKLSDAFENNLALPQLTERFDVGEYLKPFKAITQQTVSTDKNIKTDEKVLDEPATEKMLIGALARDPRGMKYLEELTSGFPLPAIKEFSPTYNENLKKVQDYVKGNPKERERLALQGIIPGTPVMDEYISDLAQSQTQAKKKYDAGIKDLVAASTTDMDLFKKETPFKDPNAMTEYQRQSLDLRRQSEARLRAKDAAEGSGGNGNVDVADEVPLYYGPGGKEVAVGKNVVKIHIPKKNFVGANAIDLTTGQPARLTKSSNDYEVVSVGNYPVLTKDIRLRDSDGKERTLKKGSLVQPKYAREYPQNVQEKPFIHVQEKTGTSGSRDRLVDYEYMPKGLTKAQNEALGAFKPASKGSASGENKKTAQASQIKALVGKPGYEGYTEKELIEYYKSQGYVIK